MQIVTEWVTYLRAEKLFGPDDPLFPKTRLVMNESSGFKAEGLTRECWSNTSPIRDIFRAAFAGVGLDYFNPHSLRKTLTDLGQRMCQTPEQFKAWSQNLGHDSPLTTFTSYGQISHDRQAEVIKGLTSVERKTDKLDLIMEKLGIINQ